MDPKIEAMLRTAEEAVNRLVAGCGKTGKLYQRSPRSVAQVSRTGKWLLSAVGALRKELTAAPKHQEPACETAQEDEE